MFIQMLFPISLSSYVDNKKMSWYIMDADFINDFRRKLAEDCCYHKSRQDFHENYEWIEGYWRANSMDCDRFCIKYGAYFWSLPIIQELSKEFAFSECVGNSTKPNYEQTDEIAKATMYLRYNAGLPAPDGIPDCSSIGCENNKSSKGWCTRTYANKWVTADYAAFKALMYIVRQIRNNLFHGKKMELEGKQYERNKRLIKTATEITKEILNNLRDAEIYVQ